MRKINHRRKLVEAEGRVHAVKRGRRGRLHFENLLWLHRLLDLGLRLSFIKRLGVKNALNLEINEVEMGFDNLSEAFDGTRILFMTDFHVDGLEGLAERVIEAVGVIDYDYCILGGDYSFDWGKNCDLAYSRMREIAKVLVEKSRVFGVLGNHDRYRMAEVLGECGVEMLMNENVCLEKDGGKIYLGGLDDCHYYGAEDLALAGEGISDGAFGMMVCHSAEVYEGVAGAGYSLYLAGHCHGGQICLPGGVEVVSSATVPRRFLSGEWDYEGMKGFTSKGVGVSGVAVRFFCL